MKRKDNNCVGILSDQGEAVTTSDLSEYTILNVSAEMYVVFEMLYFSNHRMDKRKSFVFPRHY